MSSVSQRPQPQSDEFIPYSATALRTVDGPCGPIQDFLTEAPTNLDHSTVSSFGEEWLKFSRLPPEEIEKIGREYFDSSLDESFSPTERVLDAGCGNGRWSCFIAPRVGTVDAIDPSLAVFSAQKNTRHLSNVRVTRASINDLPFPDESFDTIICLGVIHHLPNPLAALQALRAKLKPGGRLFFYLYYALDNRGIGFRLLFAAVHLARKVISSLPAVIKLPICDFIAATIYWPLARLTGLARSSGVPASVADKIPLSIYWDKSWTVLRNDALDRFGTPLEQRFSKEDLHQLISQAGFGQIAFSPTAPFWHGCARRVEISRPMKV